MMMISTNHRAPGKGKLTSQLIQSTGRTMIVVLRWLGITPDLMRLLVSVNP